MHISNTLAALSATQLTWPEALLIALDFTLAFALFLMLFSIVCNRIKGRREEQVSRSNVDMETGMACDEKRMLV